VCSAFVEHFDQLILDYSTLIGLYMHIANAMKNFTHTGREGRKDGRRGRGGMEGRRGKGKGGEGRGRGERDRGEWEGACNSMASF